ncbi:7SK snRNA methylphosphate capping enzyme [Euphorbia peplus]|nr:7SK snRNA methylphosphate capping enzyme [Euphorbia peplus]
MTEEKGLKNEHEEKTNNKRKKKNKKNKQHQQNQEQNQVDKEKENQIQEMKKKQEKDDEKDKEQAQQVNNNDNNNKKRKRKEVFPFGNYRNYYGYRIGHGMEEDPRLRVFDSKWFQGKDCLDIGCNSGIFTIQIAKKFHCRKILGIDIDSGRISDANWHLQKSTRDNQAGKINTKESQCHVRKDVKGSQHSATAMSVEEKEIVGDGSHPDERNLFDIVSFRKENFVQSWLHEEEQYDTILCLSVTKWIHLNWGDEGLITSFSKIWKLLRPGGILVLEPQPWKSYESNRLVSETVTMNYRNIIFRPQHFEEILLDKIGFRKVENVTSALSGSTAGFNRPIFAYHK